MKVLVDAQKKLNIPLSNPENDLLGNQLLLFDNTAALNNETFPQFKVNLNSHQLSELSCLFRACSATCGQTGAYSELLKGKVHWTNICSQSIQCFFILDETSFS